MVQRNRFNCSFLRFSLNYIFGFVAMCDRVHDVDTIFQLLTTACESLF